MHSKVTGQSGGSPSGFCYQWIGAMALCLCFIIGFVPATARADYICGDVNSDSTVNILDITFLYNYLFKGYPGPTIREAADVDDIAGINTNDVAVLIDDFYQSGGPPQCGPKPDTTLPVTDDTLLIVGGRVPAGMALCEVQVRLRVQNSTYGLSLPLSFNCQTSGVVCDSIVFPAGLNDDFPLYAKEYDNTEQKTVIALNALAYPGMAPSEEYLLASIWFTLTSVDEFQDQIIELDTTGYAPENIVIFTKNKPNHEAYIPTVVFNPDEVLNYDSDGDGVFDDEDNCVLVPNSDQANDDGDMFGNACDNCPDTPNDDQLDTDGDQVGDACDNCISDPNQDQADADSDGLGDVCDACPLDADNDVDGDGVCGNVDNCPVTYNPSQQDSNGNGIGDACEGGYECGDINADGWINVADAVYLINFIFRDGPPPCQPE